MPAIDFAILNELSGTPKAKDVLEASDWLTKLVLLFRTGFRVGFRRLRTREDFRTTAIAGQARIDDVIGCLERHHRQLIYRILDCPYLRAENEDAFLQYRVVAVAGNAANAEGLLCAHIMRTLAISFDRAEWAASTIDVEVLDEQTRAIECVQVRHASRHEHLIVNLAWASRTAKGADELIPSAARPLPNTVASDLLVNDDWQAFCDELKRMPPAEKTARLVETAEQVALINGYDYDPIASDRNRQISGSMRQVFGSIHAANRARLYLSTDFEKPAGAFEVCDFQGRHLGEWLFSGRKNSPADESGRHNIWID